MSADEDELALPLSARLEAVRARLRAAETRAGREPGSVTLIAVSKFHPAAAIRIAYEAGQRDFGENYPQELAEKAKELADLTELRWHMIGHLQSNKVKLVMPFLHCLHTVDSAHAVTELSRRATLAEKRLSVLVQVDIGGEQQKFGCDPQELGEVLAAVEGARPLRLRGLMTLPPPAEGEAEQRRPFAALRMHQSLHGGIERLPELSMGMSDDLEAAVLEGATMVRIGTAIFGARPVPERAGAR
jgi:PLP dependent protein